ncbi:MAG TPA: hypothetical protein VFJ61_10845 [Solirubrobacterales bacterium]|nr:hypothetical protein [Solirubrobacterales bacterium]
MKRALILALVVLGCAAPSSAAAAEACAPYSGSGVPTISSAEGPEDFCWEVPLNAGQELVQIDEQHVGVLSKTGEMAWVITAGPARDAEGSAVPTSIAVAGPREVKLTVHHRAGNPAEGGAPFRYPIDQGAAYETGHATVTANYDTPDPPPPPPVAASAPTCTVPSLRHRSLKASREILLAAGYHLGPVRGERRRGSKVVRQYRPPGTVLPAGTEVGVKLG